MASDDAQKIRGIVQDGEGRAISEARVSVEGYGDESMVTDTSSSFVLSAHAGDDQQVALHAEKNG